MEGSRIGQAVAVALAGTIALAYVQVSSVPAQPAPPAPSMGEVVSYVKTDFEWFRTEFPRSPAWWKGVATSSSENFGLLRTALSEGNIDSSAR